MSSKASRLGQHPNCCRLDTIDCSDRKGDGDIGEKTLDKICYQSLIDAYAYFFSC